MMWTEVVIAYLEALSCHLSERPEEKHRTSVKIVSEMRFQPGVT
jgi:hypothetical protein